MYIIFQIAREDYDHWTLNIRNSIYMDEGLYECVAENLAGKVYCSANIKLIGQCADLLLTYLSQTLPNI